MSEESILSSNEETTPVENTESQAVVNESPAVTNVELTQLLSEEYRDAANLKDFKDVNQLAKSYVELQKLVGNSIRLPAEDASPEAISDFYEKIKNVEGVLIKNDENLLNKLGKPEKAEEYDFNHIVEKVPEIEADLNAFKETAFELGLTKDQASKLAEMRFNEIESSIKEMEVSRQNGEQALKQLWGQGS